MGGEGEEGFCVFLIVTLQKSIMGHRIKKEKVFLNRYRIGSVVYRNVR